ncbi:glycerol-3-phosphate dehydrogenase [Rhodoferax sp. U11-2br]|uniref:glycerol-3-phosphate dehydrogenase n=1 Tax=Rhodoferax sp. U11-2br TaxID=2838878 RepID=UPI001BEB74E5|nr:glycerol-3-phosphate dehydrogenase [Rhodoferax sp. U11-2br]MBT3068653.1 glycerol-3-phosphate dehydrogenase [Rhodoferax sp. U11-2br]
MNDHPRASPTASYDVLVVGGGINGAGIARDLAGRGLSVLLAEKDDLAAHTSSASTKLIHGGLRYLEYYEFGLVRKALAEREVLLRSAPHIMWPLRFVMPHDPAMRPAWMIRIGLFLYDHLARRELLPGSRGLNLRQHPAGAPLQSRFKQGFEYSDGWVDDARLVVLLAMDAAEHGARICTRCEVTQVQRTGDTGWQVNLRHRDGHIEPVQARAVVNATGPWASQFLRDSAQHKAVRSLRHVKGSHIVVPRVFEHDYAYIFQNADRRIIFAIPYERDFTLIGTTDIEYHGGLDAVHINQDEVSYLCEQASRYFQKPIREQDVVWSYSGVRPLLDAAEGTDASAVTRDYELELDTQAAPLMSVWGGKITTFRKLAEEAADRLCAALGAGNAAWTAHASLPGADLCKGLELPAGSVKDMPHALEMLVRQHPELPPALLQRWLRSYGSRLQTFLKVGALGQQVAPGLFEAELHYLHQHEWARCADDVLWRRSKLGLHLTETERQQVASWCQQHWPTSGPN